MSSRGFAVELLCNDERVLTTLGEIQLKRWWWVWEWYMWSKKVGRAILEDHSTLMEIPFSAEEEVLVCMGNVVVEVGFLFRSDVSFMGVLKGLNEWVKRYEAMR